MPVNVKVGVIGGSGLDDPDIVTDRIERVVDTPFGKPSDVLIEGKIDGTPCILLARHGRSHDISPTQVNYRANIWALQHLGCTHVIVSTACGSLQEDIKPGDIVIINSFIDRTTKREQTLYGGPDESRKGICHLPMEPAFCEETRQVIIETAKSLDINVRPKGTCVTIEGPRFSSKAESLVFRSWSADVINMTTVPEVVLAKEAGLCYAAIALATDYDCWRETGERVNVADVLAMFKKNVGKITQLLRATVPRIAERNWDKTIADLKGVVEGSVMAAK